jgi:hypothetical protein
VCPIDASNAEVWTLNSPIEACGGENATRTLAPSENVFATPSIVNSLLNIPLPSVENCDGALLNGALRKRMSVPFTVPGASSVNSIAFPENSGNSRMRRSSTTWPSDASAVESSGVSATTSMVSATSPMAI